MMAKVDILLPYWGEFSFLKEAVESILAQTEPDWRLVVADDCYPSDEASVYFSKMNDPRISYRRHDSNIGITNNFNYLLEQTLSPYCIIIGCDDRMLPNYLQAALNGVGKADFYQPGVKIINEMGVSYIPLVDRVKYFLRPKQSGLYNGESLAVSLCRGNWLYFPSILWKTSSIKNYGFNPKYKIAEDVLLQLSMIKDGAVLSYDTTVCFEYRRSAMSLSSREKRRGGVRFGEEDEVYDRISAEFSAIGWKRASRAAKFRIISRIHRLVS